MIDVWSKPEIPFVSHAIDRVEMANCSHQSQFQNEAILFYPCHHIAYLINTCIQIETKIILKWIALNKKIHFLRTSAPYHLLRLIWLALFSLVAFHFAPNDLCIFVYIKWYAIFFLVRCCYYFFGSTYDFKFYSECSKQINSGLYHRVTIMCVV